MLKREMPAPSFAEVAMENRLDPNEPLLRLRDLKRMMKLTTLGEEKKIGKPRGIWNNGARGGR